MASMRMNLICPSHSVSSKSYEIQFHDFEALSASYKGNPLGMFSHITSIEELWCFVYYCEHAAEITVELPLIWDTMMAMRLYN